jgi:hypothetical protein
MFDHPDYRALYWQWDINKPYRTYFNLVEELAGPGLFDIPASTWSRGSVIGRPGLCRLRRSCSAGDLRAGFTPEVDTADKHKPCATGSTIFQGGLTLKKKRSL